MQHPASPPASKAVVEPAGPGSRKCHRLVRLYYGVRTTAFAALSVAIGMHMSGQGYGAPAWVALVLQFLVYPHLLYWRARTARDSLRAEQAHLKLDSLLVGIWAAAIGFPVWIAFTLFLGTTLNNAINGGARGALIALLTFSAGALAWALFAGFHFSPDTAVPVTALCMVGLAVYVTGLGALTFEQNQELRDTRQALRQSELRLRTTVEASPMVLFTLDRQGIFQVSTGAGLRRLGLRPGEVVGQSVFELYKNAPDILDCVTRALKGDVISHTSEVAGVTWDTHYVPMLDEKDSVQGVVGAAFDVTELKRAEAAVRALNENLERRVENRTAALALANREMESFAYSISHDLRAPVRALRGFSDILLREHAQGLDEEASRLLGRIARNAQRMGDMVDDLLRLSRLGRDELDRQPVDIHAVVKEVVAAHSGEYPLTRVVTAALPGAHCDRGLIRQVLENLIGNALKYSSKAAAPVVQIGFEMHGAETVYFVRDNGTGFDMQYADKLFGIFQRLHADSDFPGSGVGLVIVKRIIERHGGRTWADASPEQGATFFFTLG